MKNNITNESIVEACLYIAGDEGITISELEKILKLDKIQIAQIIYNLSQWFNTTYHGIEIIITGERIKIVTKKTIYPHIMKLISNDRKKGISQAALEALAIIAYNNDKNITKSVISKMRGVNSDGLIASLINRNLIRISGRFENQPGRPAILTITNKFYDVFQINDLKNLPPLPEIKNQNEEDRNIFELNRDRDNDKKSNITDEKPILDDDWG